MSKVRHFRTVLRYNPEPVNDLKEGDIIEFDSMRRKVGSRTEIYNKTDELIGILYKLVAEKHSLDDIGRMVYSYEIEEVGR